MMLCAQSDARILCTGVLVDAIASEKTSLRSFPAHAHAYGHRYELVHIHIGADTHHRFAMKRIQSRELVVEPLSNVRSFHPVGALHFQDGMLKIA